MTVRTTLFSSVLLEANGTRRLDNKFKVCLIETDGGISILQLKLNLQNSSNEFFQPLIVQLVQHGWLVVPMSDLARLYSARAVVM